jgi:hypothetical protein
VGDDLRPHAGRSSEQQTVKPDHVDRVKYGYANERGNQQSHFVSQMSATKTSTDFRFIGFLSPDVMRGKRLGVAKALPPRRAGTK